MKQLLIVIAVIALVIAGYMLYKANTDRAVAPSEVEQIDVDNETEVTGQMDTDAEVEGVDAVDAASESDNTGSDATSEVADDGSDVVVIDLVGTNYQFSQEEITVQEGQTVTINFTSGEGFHDWVVDAFGTVATDRVRDGEATSVTFVADETGTFEYYCSVGDHRARGMVGTLIVE